jgi:hypothetical protein
MAKRGRRPDYLDYPEKVTAACVRKALADVEFWVDAENAKSFRARHAGERGAMLKALSAGEPRTQAEFFDKVPGSRAAKSIKVKRMRRLLRPKNNSE